MPTSTTVSFQGLPSWYSGSAAAPTYPAAGGAGGGGYNVNPGTQAGVGAYGGVPGPIGLPSPAKDLSAQFPGLGQANQRISNNILSELSGELSPETLTNISRAGAQFGVESGMPLSGESRSEQLKRLGLTTEQVQGQGLADYLSATGGISKTQTVSPETQVAIASRNATFAAAPNPAAAAAQAQSIFQQELDQLSGRMGQGGNRGTTLLGPTVAGQGTRPVSTLDPDAAFMNSPWSPPNIPAAVGPTPGVGGAYPYAGVPGTPAAPAAPWSPVTGNLYGGGPEQVTSATAPAITAPGESSNYGYDMQAMDDQWLNQVANDPSAIYDTSAGANVDMSGASDGYEEGY